MVPGDKGMGAEKEPQLVRQPHWVQFSYNFYPEESWFYQKKKFKVLSPISSSYFFFFLSILYSLPVSQSHTLPTNNLVLMWETWWGYLLTRCCKSTTPIISPYTWFADLFIYPAIARNQGSFKAATKHSGLHSFFLFSFHGNFPCVNFVGCKKNSLGSTVLLPHWFPEQVHPAHQTKALSLSCISSHAPTTAKWR